MTLTLAILAALVAAVLVLLSLRIELVATVHRDGNTVARGEARALFGWIRIPFERGPEDDEAEDEPEKPRKARKKRRMPSADDGVRLAELVMDVLRRVVRQVRVSQLSGDVLVGLDDPADTGQLWGAVGPIAVLLGEYYPDFRVRPSFAEPMLFVDAVMAIAFRPLMLVVTVVAAVLRPRALGTLIRVGRGR